uniref:CCHC-type domain-containing protein n=1 Tax=Chrysemys picta bellii TaxID=8478 RepID=A0A8C3HNC2_CHRPI
GAPWVFWGCGAAGAGGGAAGGEGWRGWGHGPQSARARRPVAKACYACGQAGHLKRDWCPIPQVGRGGREPRRLRACWACGRREHLERECPSPRNTAQGNPGRVGPVKDKRKILRPGTAQRWDWTMSQGVCWLGKMW